jgi:hypothetical protein
MEKSEPTQQHTPKEDDSEEDGPISQHAEDQDLEKGLSTRLGIDETNEEQAKSDANEQDVSTPPHANVIAGEDYSVFTVPQKRSIIVAGSFLAWFSPVSGCHG